MGVEPALEPGDLLADAAEEEEEPGGPIRIAAAPGGLRPAQSEVVGFLAVLDDALERAVRDVAVASAEEEQRGEDAREASIAILERVHGEEDDGEDADAQQGVEAGIGLGAAVPREERLHVRGGLERAGGLENDPEFATIGIEGGDVIWQRLPVAAVPFVLQAELEKVAMQLAQDIGGKRDSLRRARRPAP